MPCPNHIEVTNRTRRTQWCASGQYTPILHLLLRILLCCGAWVVHAADKDTPASYRIYLDADQTNSASSGQSIALGIRAALNEVDWQLGGHAVELVLKDHHGSTPRSQYHLQQFVEDPNGLAVYGGLHSPPLLASREFIHANNVLTLVPWAAATPITRYAGDPNWIFRLSLDDSKAGQVIVEDVVSRSNFKQPYLLLEDTGWGKANEKTMTRALDSLGIKAAGLYFFQWGIGQHEARAILEKAVSSGADSFILVANAPEGVTFAKAMLSLEPDRQRAIRSHWGITGGTFVDTLGLDQLALLDLRFIQTGFSFFDTPLSALAQRALSSAAKAKGLAQLSASDIKAPAGFIHAYDLTRLLIAAADQSVLTGDAKQDAARIRTALESLSQPVSGLLKTYTQAFAPYTQVAFDAHEALNANDFVMAKYDAQGHIRLLPAPKLTQ